MKQKPKIIVLGNEKGGSGKSTTAMHVFVALARRGYRVGAMDLDIRQRSFFRYLENRRDWSRRKGVDIVMPLMAQVEDSTLPNRTEAWNEEAERFHGAISALSETCNAIIIDCPGANSNLSRLGHSVADLLITPMNDSFVDFDLLARVDAATGDIKGPSIYSEMVWESRKVRAETGLGPIDWVVVRNRAPVDSGQNRHRVSEVLKRLSNRIGFRVAPGLSERPIFRELFLSGLTLLDLREPAAGKQLNMSHIAARHEVRELMNTLALTSPRV